MNWLCEACIYYPPSSCDGKPCSQCDPESHFNNHFESKELVIYVPSKNCETNADRIRSMSDEELAEMFWNRADCELCPNRKAYCSDDCKKNWLDWLKQECET